MHGVTGSYVSAHSVDTLKCIIHTARGSALNGVSIFVFDSSCVVRQMRRFEANRNYSLAEDSALARYDLSIEQLDSMNWTVEFSQ